MNKINRRDVVKTMGAASALAWLGPHGFLQAFAETAGSPLRLSVRANRTVEFEGAWMPRVVEGRIPSALRGTLYRAAPGQREVFGVSLKHFFDGDAFITSYQFADGTVKGLSRFVNTPERAYEQQHKKMSYHEFGTTCSGAKSFKNSPNVNVFPIESDLFALSESAAPVKLDPQTLESQGSWYFHDSIPTGMTFTAHPRRDPKTGDIYVYGVTQSLSPKMNVFVLRKGDSKFRQISSIDANGVYPVHDFMMTENYLIFVLPPYYVSLWGMMTGSTCVADNIILEPNGPLRIFVVRKDGKGRPVLVQGDPAPMIFHHANAIETEGGRKIKFYSMEVESGAVMDMLKNWRADKLPPTPPEWLSEFELDLERRKVIGHTRLTSGSTIDFPAIDNDTLGTQLGRVFAVEASDPTDGLRFNSLIAFDLDSRREQRVAAGVEQGFGEPIFVSGGGQGFVLVQGYDGTKDESFMDIRRASDLGLEARVWYGRRIPFGFHGNFVPAF